MELNDKKEAFSIAYCRAVIAVAGFTVGKPEIDRDSVDLTVYSVNAPYSRLDMQLKATSQDFLKEDGVHFPLPIKNYDDLRTTEVIVPRILLIVVMPTNPEDWLVQTTEQLVMRRCGYWVSLRGRPNSGNDETVTVVLPPENLFNVSALQRIMKTVGEGGSP